jgi:NADP-dependent 3-hydroxy acid dehydrogenase YdfG
MTYAQKKQIIGAMQRLVPAHAPVPQSVEVLASLTELTNDLIRVYQGQGKLRENPFTEAAERRIHLYEDLIRSEVTGKVVLVTGGEGCVGQALITSLLDLGARQIVCLDKANLPACCLIQSAERLEYRTVDIRDAAAVTSSFAAIRPQIVFHLAAQRLPGLAEIEIRETITTNLIGTCNVIQACQMYQVEKCMFSSTGKASRYYTADVYAASKKLCEWLFAKAALTGNTIYAAVRFTHILDNSSIEEKIATGIENGIVNLHKPDIDLLPQNVSEANYLLLNGLVEAVPQQLKMLIVRDLGWPIDLLELVLFKIAQSGKKVPLYFNGLQAGYDEPFFHGQFDPTLGTEVNPLISAIEDIDRTYDRSGTMVISKMSKFCIAELDRQVAALIELASDPNFPESQLKAVQAKAIKAVATSIFAQISPQRILSILTLGVNPKLFAAQGVDVKVFREVLAIVLGGIFGRLNRLEDFTPADVASLPEVIQLLHQIPELATEICYLESFVARVLAQPSQIESIEDRPHKEALMSSYEHLNHQLAA